MNHLVKMKLFLFALIIGVLYTPIICCAKEGEELIPVYAEDIADGTYEVQVESSSSMFRVVKAVLHVADGSMTADLTLSGTGYLKLFMGTGEEASEAGEENYIPYVEGEDGAYTYTIPVEALNIEFDCAAYSKRKERWYDRQLVMTAPSLSGGEPSEEPSGESSADSGEEKQNQVSSKQAEAGDGSYTIEVTLTGGSGRAFVSSPAHIEILGGEAVASVEWSSSDYDYMIVDGKKYFPVNEEGNSTFEIPVSAWDEEITVTADTVAMSEPHEITYTLTFHADTLKKEQEEGRYVAVVIGIAVLLLAVFAVNRMYGHRKKALFSFVLLFLMFHSAGCAAIVDVQKENTEEYRLETRDKNISSGLRYEKSMELEYAEKFAVDYYQGGYRLASVADGRRYLIVPEGKSAPEDLEDDVVILQHPSERIYLVATAVMDMVCELDALEAVRFSGQKADGWCMQEVQNEMKNGTILYAGKYSAPDYELLVSEGCSLAIENNMISHSPEVVEKMEEFGIPVLVDFSSYESHPLGRVEWIKLYGVLFEKEEQAKAAFDEQMRLMERAAEGKASEKTVAFFFITSSGMVNVRVSSDYIPKMIELAGGKYIFDDLGTEDSNRSSMTMQMEEFYHAAKEADYLIYNSTIDGEISSLEELLKKEELLKDFKAVQAGSVWCTSRNLYQQSMSIGQMTRDIHNMLSGEADRQKDILYLYRLK